MRLLLCLALVVGMPMAAAANRVDLARARTHYNLRQFDEAIAAATSARRSPETADSAAIVLARAHLERYRERADPTDLIDARTALGLVRTVSLGERDQLELLLAFGESLFLEDDFGAAAEMFESGLERATNTSPELAESMLEWWASAIERQVEYLPRERRVIAFTRVADRMAEELSRNPSSAAAGYWIVVAYRGVGELDRAWDAAVAAWVRARLLGERSPMVRADLDRLVLTGLIPDRVKRLPDAQRAGAQSQFKADWELVREKWK